MKSIRPIVAWMTLVLISQPLPAAEKINERDRAVHVLNRLSFGPRPGDVDQVMRLGVQEYIRRQLYPERIADPAVTRRLAPLSTLSMSSGQITETFMKPLYEARREKKKEAKPADGQESLKRLRESIPPERRPKRLMEELVAARIIRATYSERQLNEVMVDFWMNHFNVFAGKGADRFLLTSFEQETVRPRVWGKFEDLLLATAKSPAMLFYLDNARSIASPENRPLNSRLASLERYSGRRAGSMRSNEKLQVRQLTRKGGLNENYARELMELHTLGVDGGYTQKDVTELARILTGWSIVPPNQGSGFVFRSMLHDSGSKTVLGKTFSAGGGIEEGEAVIRSLARHPATARHLSTKLCQKLVSDTPPPQLVDRVAKSFLQSGGDLRETVRAIVESPEFMDPSQYRSKVKTPFEYVVSSLRATGAELTHATALYRSLQEMGQPLYLAEAPTGYSELGEAWVNSGTFVARLNFAINLMAGKVPGAKVDASRLPLLTGAGEPIRRAGELLVGGELSEATLSVIDQRLAQEQSADSRARTTLLTGLILGSPEFQRQ